jgi:hypothetical protein
MKLMHGTSANNQTIFVEGVKPRTGLGNWFKNNQLPSLEGFVYLGNRKDAVDFHAARTALINDSDCMILTIEVDEINLYPDENLFVESGLVFKEQLAVAQSKVVPAKNQWESSLVSRGIVAHQGSIPVENIILTETYPYEESMWSIFTKGRERTLEEFDIGFMCYTNCQTKYGMDLSYVDGFEKINETEYKVVLK